MAGIEGFDSRLSEVEKLNAGFNEVDQLNSRMTKMEKGNTSDSSEVKEQLREM